MQPIVVTRNDYTLIFSEPLSLSSFNLFKLNGMFDCRRHTDDPKGFDHKCTTKI